MRKTLSGRAKKHHEIATVAAYAARWSRLELESFLSSRDLRDMILTGTKKSVRLESCLTVLQALGSLEIASHINCTYDLYKI